MIALSREQVQQVVMEEKVRATSATFPFDLSSIISKAGEVFGFTVDEGKVSSLVDEEVSKESSFDGAVLMVRGPYSVNSQVEVVSEDGRHVNITLCVLQQTILEEKLRSIAKLLLDEEAVELFAGCDEEYLYEVLSEASETAFYELLAQKAKDLPIFGVRFADDGGFKLESLT